MLWKSTYIGVPENFYPSKPDHDTKKLMEEERGLWGVGLVLNSGILQSYESQVWIMS